MDVKVELQGWDEVRRMLSELPEKLMKKAIREGLKKASRPMVAICRARAPIGQSVDYWEGPNKRATPGTLRRSIMTAAVSRRGMYLQGGVKITHGRYKSGKKKGQFVKNDAYYWYWVAKGHILKRGKKTIGHVPGNPFLTEAFASHAKRGIDAVRDEISIAIRDINARGIHA